jgi:RNA polymerase sigma-70 factor (ECF subfamily)
MNMYAEMADSDLVAHAQSGDCAAFDALFERVQFDLLKVAMRITRNESEAEEAVQNALLLIFRKIQHFRGDAQFTTWAHRVAVTAALQILRKKRRRPQTVEMSTLTPGTTENALEYYQGGGSRDASESIELRQLVRGITDGIAALPDLDRQVMQRYIFDEAPVEEVASELGLTISAVKSRIHRARKRVRADVAHLAG